MPKSPARRPVREGERGDRERPPPLRASTTNNGLSRILVAALAATAVLSIAAPALATKTQTWKTCEPGTKDYVGAYRVFDNAWMVRAARGSACIALD
jgi:hypothetical protein